MGSSSGNGKANGDEAGASEQGDREGVVLGLAVAGGPLRPSILQKWGAGWPRLQSRQRDRPSDGSSAHEQSKS
jgi:hypothetical protein